MSTKSKNQKSKKNERHAFKINQQEDKKRKEFCIRS
jgi:hypothetical protein